jgi:hypothetical protein
VVSNIVITIWKFTRNQKKARGFSAITAPFLISDFDLFLTQVSAEIIFWLGKASRWFLHTQSRPPAYIYTLI